MIEMKYLSEDKTSVDLGSHWDM